MKRQLHYCSPPGSNRTLPTDHEQRSSSSDSSVQPSSSSLSVIPPTVRSSLVVPPPRRLGRVMSTPMSLSTNRDGGSSSSSSSLLLFHQSHRTTTSSSSISISNNNNNARQYRTSPLMTKSGMQLPLSHARSFDEKPPLPPEVAVMNIRHAIQTITSSSNNSGDCKPSSSPASSSSSSPTSTPKISTAASSSTSSTASVSDDENDESLLSTHVTATISATTRSQKRLNRSLSSDDFDTSNHHHHHHDHNNNDVHWMTSLITSSKNSSSPPQEMKLTSVRKRPSPRCSPNNDTNHHNECDHSYNDHSNTLQQRSSPPSSSLSQQLYMAQNSTTDTPSTSPNKTTPATSFRNGVSIQQQHNKSGSFRRRKGTKGGAMRKSLLRNKSFLLLRYMYLHRYFTTKRRVIFVLYTIATVLSVLFIVSFSLSFLSSHRIMMTKIFFLSSSSLPSPGTLIGTNIGGLSTSNRSMSTKNGGRIVPKPWNIGPDQEQKLEKRPSTAGTTATNNSSNDYPNDAKQQQQQQISQPRKGTTTTTNNNNNIIHTLRGRFKKHNIITQKKTLATKKDSQPNNKPYKWFGFSHLLLPPKNNTIRQQHEQQTLAAATSTTTTTTTSINANSTLATNFALRGGATMNSVKAKDSSGSSPIVVTGKVYNFNRYTQFAPQCNNDDTMSVNDIDFTIATQLSYNRLWMMEYHCLRWTQAMSLAIYIGNNQTTASITSESIRHEMIQMGCLEQQDITVQVLSGYSDEEYPVNILRNMALSKVRTTHVVYVDVDFWVSIDLYTILNQHRYVLLSNKKLALVVPAFQLSRQCKEWRDCREMNIPKMPHTKDELVDLMVNHQANAFDPSNRGGHGSTRYKDWLLQLEDELVPIDCVKSNRYEPYLVFRLCNDLPPFQESFTGYGKNKMTWMMQLRRTGYQLMQLGGAFAVHYPHLDSTARMHWNGGVDGSQLPKPNDSSVDLSKFKRGQIDETFVAFRHWLATSIPDHSVLPMCDDAQDDDQRLWIAPDKVITVKT